MSKKSATAAERRHMDRIASMDCILCRELGQRQEGRTTVHHIREGSGISQRASHYLTLPLCGDCHQGDNGIHGDRTLLRIAKTDELGLLARTIEELSK